MYFFIIYFKCVTYILFLIIELIFSKVILKTQGMLKYFNKIVSQCNRHEYVKPVSFI